ncbi:hypothetical protein F0169_11580, partial [Pseudomonas sp. MAFF 212408]|nr:hypothetical protein [Pseudomonas kitaguniensis]
KVMPDKAGPLKVTPDAGPLPKVMPDASPFRVITPTPFTPTPRPEVNVTNDSNAQVHVEVNINHCPCPDTGVIHDKAVPPRVTITPRVLPHVPPINRRIDTSVLPNTDLQHKPIPFHVAPHFKHPENTVPTPGVKPYLPLPSPDLTSPAPAEYQTSLRRQGFINRSRSGN